MFAEDSQYYYGITVYIIAISYEDMNHYFGEDIIQYVSLEYLTNIDPRIYYFCRDLESGGEATIYCYEDCMVEVNKEGVFWNE